MGWVGHGPLISTEETLTEGSRGEVGVEGVALGQLPDEVAHGIEGDKSNGGHWRDRGNGMFSAGGSPDGIAPGTRSEPTVTPKLTKVWLGEGVGSIPKRTFGKFIDLRELNPSEKVIHAG
jgi:hypothetical protein